VNSEQAPYLRDLAYVDGARRFDMGERDFFVSLEMAAIGMDYVGGLGRPAVAERLRMLTGRLAEGLRGSGVTMPDARVRAPHILSLGFPDGMPPDLPARLAASHIHAAARLGRLRLSPHVYNDEADVDRFCTALGRLL